MKDKNYLSFRRASFTAYLWLDLIILSLLCSIVFYGIGILLVWLLPASFDTCLLSWSRCIIDALVLTCLIFGAHIVRVYPETRELRLFNLYNLPLYNRIAADNIVLILVFGRRKLKYNTEIYTRTGKKYKISIFNHQEFTKLMIKYNPQITVREFE